MYGWQPTVKLVRIIGTIFLGSPFFHKLCGSYENSEMLCRLLGSLPGPTSISNVSKERGNFLLQPRHHIRVSRMATLVGWSPSSEGWAKLKTDGFVSSKPGRGGTRGPLRDHTGRWLGGFGRVLGETDSLIAGWWALRDGPQLARRMGIQFLEIDQMDAEVLQISLGNNLTRIFTHYQLSRNARVFVGNSGIAERDKFLGKRLGRPVSVRSLVETSWRLDMAAPFGKSHL